MSEMVERVAKAIYCEEYAEEYWPPSDVNLLLAQARAAIAAQLTLMREPTPEILNVGIQGGTGGTLCSWQMMIDEMLLGVLPAKEGRPDAISGHRGCTASRVASDRNEYTLKER